MRDNGSPEYIEIASIVRDGHGLGTQLREVIDPDTVERYAEDMARDDVFHLVDLVEVGDGTYGGIRVRLSGGAAKSSPRPRRGRSSPGRKRTQPK